MLPKSLSYYAVSYYSAFLCGVLPFTFKNGRFSLSKVGVELWTCQVCLAITMNVKNYMDLAKDPCNNALSCAIYVQELLNAVTVSLQVLLLLYNRNQIKGCLNCLTDVTTVSKDVCRISSGMKARKTLLPTVYNVIFTIFTVGRCVFMFAIKPGTRFIEMVRKTLLFICAF